MAPASNKRKRPLPPGVQTLFKLLPDAKKLKIPATELKKQRKLAESGIDYEPEEEDMRVFKTERASSSTASPSVATHRYALPTHVCNSGGSCLP